MEQKSFSNPNIKESYLQINHPCGMTILISEKPFRVSSACLKIRYGEINTKVYLPDQKKTLNIPRGTAHFLEHKMFEDENGNDMMNRFASMGGDANAYTGWESTTYYFTSTEHFSENLQTLLHMIAFPHFSEDSIRREKQIIQEELNGYLDDPNNCAYVKMKKNLYHKHPVRYDLGGSKATLTHITPDVLYSVHHYLYTPDRMTLGICGNPSEINKDEIIRMVSSVFGDESDIKSVRYLYENEPLAIRTAKASIRKNVSSTGFYMGWKGPSFLDIPKISVLQKSLTMDILQDCLFSGSADLRNDLMEKELTMGGLGYGASLSESYSFSYCSGWTEHPDKVQECILGQIKKYAENGIPYEAVERNKKAALASFIEAFDSTDTIAEMLASYSQYELNIFDIFDYYRTVTVSDCNDALRAMYDPDCNTLLTIIPSA